MLTSRLIWLFLGLVASVFLIPASPLAVELNKDSTSIYIGTATKSKDKVYFPVMNGYFWNKLDLQSKIFVLEGMDNGEYLLFLETAENKNSAKVTPALIDGLLSLHIDDFKLSDLAEQIDMFYKDSANRQIPVIEAYRYISKRIKGATQQELNKLAASLRKKYNQIR